MDSTAFQEVVRFCLGSDAYRKERVPAFVGAVDGLPEAPMAALLGKAHLAGLMASTVARLDVRSPRLQAAATRMAPMLRARAVFNRNLHAELIHIGLRLAEMGSDARPVVLKGIACWDAYYADPIARRVRDLDLMIEDAEDADAVFAALESAGYEALSFENDDRGARELFRDGDSYSVPPYRIRRRADIEFEDRVSLEDAIRRHGAETGLELVDDEGPILTVDVELHKAFFATETGAFALSVPTDFRASDALPGFREMTTGTALAYTGVKLALDILETLSGEEPNFKCLKLAADFVRILERSDQRDLETAIAVVQRWDCLHHFIDTLRATRELAPEIGVRGLPPSDGDDSLDLLLAAAATSFEQEVSCSA